jgi:hypothetical protein
MVTPHRQPAGIPAAGQFAPALQSEPCFTLDGAAGREEQLDRARSAYLPAVDAACLLKEAQGQLAAGDPEARTVIDALARNPSTAGSCTRQWSSTTGLWSGSGRRRGDGSEATTRLVVHNPSTALRTLEVIARTDGGKVRYEAWKQMRVRNARR